ncbi:peptide chain release factor N(5)-glutamine methyltransferase [Flavobacterium antarcticum]|uniref:peptide chain release factor N(5)-glutamine methyltransferase n=1 Tax=Flavobacterium antarcticum TaxID=271155 RepID=UPI0003B68EFE|nr:peptide chain release factor N(5)-glutamine methyltransferase [Flavobacterium antarcticum]
MNAKLYRTKFIEALEPIHGMDEAESFFYLILEDKHKMKRIDLALNTDFEFSGDAINVWENLITELKKEIPIQYLLGNTEFYGLPFAVNENVLIPRPETEELVDWIITEEKKIERFKDRRIEGLQDLKILDIGTGSGCIAISLAKNIPYAKVFAIDVSPEALQVAKLNAEQNKVEVIFLEKDILQTGDLMEQFDIIVSNPPYVRNLEKHEIKANVLENEPHLALFVDDFDALIFYRKIALWATKNLNNGGQLFFEINQYLGNEMIQLLNELSFSDIELRKDIYGNDRMTRAVWNKQNKF